MASASPGQAAPAAWGTAFGLNRCGSLPQRERREKSAPSFGALQLVPGVLIPGSLFPLPGGSRLTGCPRAADTVRSLVSAHTRRYPERMRSHEAQPPRRMAVGARGSALRCPGIRARR